jgi:Holliday junction resolvase RusA-like endonuclease
MLKIVEAPARHKSPIIISLHGTPQGKARPRFSSKSGTAFTPAHTRQYEAALRLAAQEVMNGQPPLDGPLVVDVLVAMPVPASWSQAKRIAANNGDIRPTTRPDVDNVLKMLDGLNEIVWRDDRQIVDAHVLKRYSTIPRLRIEVRQWGAQ